MARVFVLNQPPGDFESIFISLKSDFFSHDEYLWWCGWHLNRMEVPRRLNDEGRAVITEEWSEWETLRVFSPAAELRFTRRAGNLICLLLTESESTPIGWCNSGDFDIVETHRVLIGEPPKSNIPTEHLLEITYPRSFNYGVTLNRNQVVCLLVKEYLDHVGRLTYSRYCSVDVKKKSQLEVRT